jgi:hypothetical protein
MRKVVERKVRRIIRDNPSIDQKLLRDSLELIAALRRAGAKQREFSILPSTQPVLKLKPLRTELD